MQTFNANPCDVIQRLIRTPIAASFSSRPGGPTQTPVRPGTRVAATPKSATASDQRLLDVAHVPMDVAPIGTEIENRIPDELARAVVRHVAAAVGLEHR